MRNRSVYSEIRLKNQFSIADKFLFSGIRLTPNHKSYNWGLVTQGRVRRGLHLLMKSGGKMSSSSPSRERKLGKEPEVCQLLSLAVWHCISLSMPMYRRFSACVCTWLVWGCSLTCSVYLFMQFPGSDNTGT